MDSIKISRLILCFFLLAMTVEGRTQNLESLHITVVSENAEENESFNRFYTRLKDEVTSLLTNRRAVQIQLESCNCSQDEFDSVYTRLLADEQTDILIALGPMASAVIAQRSSFSKPTFATFILDYEAQNMPLTEEETSGKNNFSYIQAPVSFQFDLEILYDIYPYKNIGIIAPDNVENLFPNFEVLFQEVVDSLQTQFTALEVMEDIPTTIAAIPAEVDAVYVFPLFNEIGQNNLTPFFDQLAEKGLPSVALLGQSMVAQGALVGYEVESNIAKMPRRMAINISKIVDGMNAADLPVFIETFGETVMINMNTVRKIGIYPSWDILTEATLLNIYDLETDRQLSLQTVILEALDRNLGLKAAEKDPLLAQGEVKLAQSELLPQVDANSALSFLDALTAESSFGTKGRLNWSAGASLSQLVYAEPALANVAIQKLLQEGEQFGLQATQLDVIIDAAAAYLGVLQARSFIDIQIGNVSVTKNNLDIANAKDAVGYSGLTDINRWKTELALNKIELNNAQTQFQNARYALNQLLNQPINEDFLIEDIGLNNDLLLVTDERLINKINNESDQNKLADFLVLEAMANLPELKQIEYSLAAQERLLKSQKRAFYLPSFALSGNWDYTFKRWEVTETPGFPSREIKPTWNMGLGVQYPIFQGGRRQANRQIAELNVLQTRDRQADFRNQLELKIRSALQTASASYFSVIQYAKASEAAGENFKIVQDAYSQGLVSVTNLVDAQNTKVQTELGAVNAGYQFVLDFLEVERAVGFYYQLSTSAEQIAFFERLNAFMLQK